MSTFDQKGFHDDKEDPQSIWSYFDAYKTSGVGKALERPDIELFQHVSEETKQKDRLLLEKKMNRPKLREQRLTGPDAFAFENFLTTQTKNHQWFGGELSVTSVYDDWVSGVDAVIEWPGDSPVRMGIDFTAAVRDQTFLRKSDKLEGNTLVKYFRSQIEQDQGVPKEMRLSLPIVVLGFDDSVFAKIAQDQTPLNKDHPLARYLIEQALVQIQTQLEIAPLHKKRGYTPKEKDLHRKSDLQQILSQLQKELEKIRSKEPDETWQRLMTTSKTHRILSGTG